MKQDIKDQIMSNSVQACDDLTLEYIAEYPVAHGQAVLHVVLASRYTESAIFKAMGAE